MKARRPPIPPREAREAVQAGRGGRGCFRGNRRKEDQGVFCWVQRQECYVLRKRDKSECPEGPAGAKDADSEHL